MPPVVAPVSAPGIRNTRSAAKPTARMYAIQRSANCTVAWPHKATAKVRTIVTARAKARAVEPCQPRSAQNASRARAPTTVLTIV